MSTIPNPRSLTYTPFGIVKMNGKEFLLKSATISHYMLGQPSQFDLTLPLRDEFGKSLIDTETIDYIFNSPYLPYDIFLGTGINGQSAKLSYCGSGLCDQIAARYNTSDGQVLEIIGPDFLGLFSQTTITPSHFLNSKSSDIALHFALEHNLTPEITPTLRPIKQYYQQNTSYLSSPSESELDLLQFLAQLEGFVYYVDGYKFYFGPPVDGNKFDVYYGNDAHPDTVYDLEIDRNPRGNKNILVIGQTYDRHNKSTYVVGQQSSAAPNLVPGQIIKFDVPVGSNPVTGQGLTFGTTTSAKYITNQEGAKDASLIVTVQAPVGTSAKQLRSMVQAKLKSLLVNEYVCQATLPGNPALQRNSPITVHDGDVISPGVRNFWVTELTHNFDTSAGFTSQFMSTNFPYGFQFDDGSNTTAVQVVNNG